MIQDIPTRLRNMTMMKQMLYPVGFAYTGDILLLKGKYIFGDIVRGRVFYVESRELKLGH